MGILYFYLLYLATHELVPLSLLGLKPKHNNVETCFLFSFVFGESVSWELHEKGSFGIGIPGSSSTGFGIPGSSSKPPSNIRKTSL